MSREIIRISEDAVSIRLSLTRVKELTGRFVYSFQAPSWKKRVRRSDALFTPARVKVRIPIHVPELFVDGKRESRTNPMVSRKRFNQIHDVAINVTPSTLSLAPFVP